MSMFVGFYHIADCVISTMQDLELAGSELEACLLETAELGELGSPKQEGVAPQSQDQVVPEDSQDVSYFYTIIFCITSIP